MLTGYRIPLPGDIRTLGDLVPLLRRRAPGLAQATALDAAAPKSACSTLSTVAEYPTAHVNAGT